MPRFAPRTLALALAAGLFVSPAFANDPVVATVNGKDIRKSELVELQNSIPQVAQVPLEMVYDQLLDHLINSRIIAAEARKQNLQDDAQLKQRLREMENRLLQEAYLAKRVDQTLTEEKVRAKYDELIQQAEPREEVRARHILVETEKEAKDIIAQLNKGASFEELAKEKSKDPGSQNGGDLGYFEKEEMVPEFSAAAFSIEPGTVGANPVKSQFGWHVIKVEDKRMAEPPAFEEVREQLHAAMAEEVIVAMVKELRDSAQVKKFDINGNPAK
ncbi:peptidylprolyl isomerase [Telmatospirillum sp. J64-1]|uniref:peptidylprolyl isomerase n=1 Tax=Telmatospirillum sp. J64-1 TaxID=2502183 RepID=UPI001C8F5FEC|nr:peptidylprolyl isomerase [Telmatospirillum sp. J64-1]